MSSPRRSRAAVALLLGQRGIETVGVFPFRVSHPDPAGIHATDEAIRVDWFEEGSR